MIHTEQKVQKMVCDYLRYQYRGVVFRSDQAGVNQTSRYARGINTALQSHRGYPDLFIARPIGKWHGLFLELKSDGARVWLKDGTLSTDKHITEQFDVITKLRILGYCANFAIGFDDAKAIIDWYLKGASGNLGLLPKATFKAKEVDNDLPF